MFETALADDKSVLFISEIKRLYLVKKMASFHLLKKIVKSISATRSENPLAISSRPLKQTSAESGLGGIRKLVINFEVT